MSYLYLHYIVVWLVYKDLCCRVYNMKCFICGSKAKIKEFDREMQELLAKAQSRTTDLKEESKAQFNQSMEELRNKKQAASEKLNELNSASGEAWKDIKSGMDSAMDELRKAFERARSHFKS